MLIYAFAVFPLLGRVETIQLIDYSKLAGAVVIRKGIMEALPVDQPGGAHQLKVRAKILRQWNLEHKHLPFFCGS